MVAIPGRKEFTVVMVWQRQDDCSTTYIAKVWAASPKQAVFFAKYEMQKETRDIDDLNRDEIEIIAIYEGHLENLYE